MVLDMLLSSLSWTGLGGSAAPCSWLWCCLALVPLASPAAATSTYLCTGYAGCKDEGYSHFGYRKAGKKMWWRMYSGHNCTNYVAYRLVKGGMSAERPWSGTGMAYNWGRANRRITDQTPMVGAVAWWKKNARGVGSSGHVAYVEEVVSASKIVISEDSWSGDFHWRTITKGSGSWPTGFVHFDDREVRAQHAVPRSAVRPRVGESLTADLGRWTPAAALRVQWLADGKPDRRRDQRDADRDVCVARPPALGRGRGHATRLRRRLRHLAAHCRACREGPSPPPPRRRSPASPRVDEVLRSAPGTWSPTPARTTIRWFADGQAHPRRRRSGASGSARSTSGSGSPCGSRPGPRAISASAVTSAPTAPGRGRAVSTSPSPFSARRRGRTWAAGSSWSPGT